MTSLSLDTSATVRSLAGRSVLQVVPSLRDDRVGRMALDVAVGLLRSGARAFVAGGGGRLVGELQAFGGEWVELEIASVSPLRRAAAVRKLATLIRGERIDLVHSHGKAAAQIAVASLRQSPTTLITGYLGMPPARGWGRSGEDVQARGHRVIACSDFAARLIAERHRVPPDRITLIPQPVETGWFDPESVDPAQVAALRESWRVRPEARVVLLPGRLQHRQGHLALVDAARMLVNGGLRGVNFVIAGNPPAEPGYAALVNERVEAQGLTPLFRHVGFCADMPSAYAAADLIVLPLERAATFSTVAVEAQSMARPVIAADLGAMPELVRGRLGEPDASRTGWLTAPHDPMALARMLSQVLAMNHRDLERIGYQARDWAQRHFSPDQITAEVLATYMEFTGR